MRPSPPLARLRCGFGAASLALAALALGLRAAEAEPALAPSAAAVQTPAPTPTPETGFEYRLQLSQMGAFNGAPLGYTPFELGWRFANGVRVRSGIDVFYYEGEEVDAAQPALGPLRYSYEMSDWRTTLAWAWPLASSFRPVAGLSLDWLRGDRKRSVEGPTPRQDAWGFFGLGAALGLECRMSQHWALSLMGRYTLGFSSTASTLAAADLGLLYLY